MLEELVMVMVMSDSEYPCMLELESDHELHSIRPFHLRFVCVFLAFFHFFLSSLYHVNKSLFYLISAPVALHISLCGLTCVSSYMNTFWKVKRYTEFVSHNLLKESRMH